MSEQFSIVTGSSRINCRVLIKKKTKNRKVFFFDTIMLNESLIYIYVCKCACVSQIFDELHKIYYFVEVK